ncbi:MAG: hypothetical protein SNJ77_11880 [Cytophagales bacterium]
MTTFDINLKSIISILTFLISFTVFCQANKPKPSNFTVVGDWMRTDENRNVKIITFKKDGTGSMEQWEYVYKVLNDKQIQFNDFDGEEYISDYVFGKNSITLSGGYFTVSETFFVKGSDESYRPVAYTDPSQLIGYWKTKDGGKIEFTKEGKMHMGGGVYGYKADENTITFTGSNGQRTVDYKIRAGELIIDFPDKVKTFNRSSAEDFADPFEKSAEKPQPKKSSGTPPVKR